MESVKAAVDAFREAAIRERVEKAIETQIEHISTFFVLLDTSVPSQKSISKLTKILRAPFVSLYNVLPDPALRLTATVFGLLSKKPNIPSANRDEDALEGWEEVQKSIISGVMDFLETTTNSQARNMASVAYGRLLCDLYLPESGPASTANTSLTLKRSAYRLLEELSTSPSVANELRDPKILGGQRLGLTLLQTDGYLTFEALLNLFVRLLPSGKEKQSAPAKHAAWIKDVFISALPSQAQVGKEITQVLEAMSSNVWDVTAKKIIDILARSKSSFTQPFDVVEVRAGNQSFPQPGPLGSVFVDTMSFLVNVDDPETGAYDILRVPFTNVMEISASNCDAAKLSINFVLSAPALLGDQPLMSQEGQQITTLSFEIEVQERRRFLDVLRSRNISHLVSRPRNPTSKKFSLTFTPILLDPLPSSDFSLLHAGPKFTKSSALESFEPDSEKDPMPEIACNTTFKPLPAQSGEHGKHEPILASPTSQGGKSREGKSTPSIQSAIRNVEISLQDFIAHGVEMPSHALLPDHSGAKTPHPNQNLRTDSQRQRDAIFGASGDELSELSESEFAAKPPKSSLPDQPFLSGTDSPLQNTAIAPRFKAKRVLDSGDEDESRQASTLKIGCRKKKRAYIIDSASEGEIVVQVDEKKTLSAIPLEFQDYAAGGIDLPEAPSLEGAAAALPHSSELRQIDGPHQIPAAPIDPDKLKSRQRENAGKPNNSLEIAVEHSNEGAVDASHADAGSSSIESIDSPPHEALPSVASESDIGILRIKDGVSVSDAKQTSAKKTKRRERATPKAKPLKRKKGNADEAEYVPSGSEDTGPPTKRNCTLKPNMPAPRSTKAAKSTRCKKATGQVPSAKGKITKGARNAVPALDFQLISIPPLLRNTGTTDHPHQDEIVTDASNRVKLSSEKESPSTATTKTEIGQTTETTDDKTLLEDNSEHCLCEDELPLDVVDRVLPVIAPDKRATLNKGKLPLGIKLPPPVSIRNEEVVQSTPRKSKESLVKSTDFEPAISDMQHPSKISSTSSLVLMTASPRSEAVENGIDAEDENDVMLNMADPAPCSLAVENIAQTESLNPQEHSFHENSLLPDNDGSLSFSPLIEDEGLPSPQEYSKIDLGAAPYEIQPPRSIIPILVKTKKDGPISKISHRSPKTVKFALKSRKAQDFDQGAGAKQNRIHNQLIHILSEISEIVIKNIDRKVDYVMRNVRIARNTLLSDGGSDLEEMRLKRVEHYNALVDLEHDYATHRRKLVNTLEEVDQLSQEGIKKLHQILHERKTLTQKFSASLLTKNLPSFLTEPMFS